MGLGGLLKQTLGHPKAHWGFHPSPSEAIETVRNSPLGPPREQAAEEMRLIMTERPGSEDSSRGSSRSCRLGWVSFSFGFVGSYERGIKEVGNSENWPLIQRGLPRPNTGNRRKGKTHITSKGVTSKPKRCVTSHFRWLPKVALDAQQDAAG